MSIAKTDLVHSIAKVVEHAKGAFKRGKTRPVSFRKAQLKALYKMVTENQENIIQALQSDFGKPKSETVLAEIGSVCGEIANCAKNIDDWVKPKAPPVDLINKMDGCLIVAEPLGTVLIIAPWNYPVQILLGCLASAIAAGNACVLKPSELTPHTSQLMADLIAKYLDNDAIHTILGGVPEATELLKHRFDHICYTGNPAVAKVIMKAAAEHLTPVTLELGGKSPCVIDPTANLAVAARRIIWGKTLNAGQTCIAPDYVLCPRDLQGKLLGEMKKAIQEFFPTGTIGSPDFAKIVNERHFQRVAKLIEGQEVAIGGKTDEKTRCIEPTVLVNVPLTAPVMQEEIFGPVLPVLECNNVDQAIEFINDREKPLALYLFTENKKSTEKIIEFTSSGGVCVNDCLMHATVPTMPFGGVGNSGIGALHGKFGFDAFTHYKPCMRKGSGLEFVNTIRYAPYSDAKVKRLTSLLFQTPDFSGKAKIQAFVLKIALVGLLAGLIWKLAWSKA